MLIQEYMRVKEQIERVLSVAGRKKLIGKTVHSQILNELENTSISPAISTISLIDMRFFKYTKEIEEILEKTGEKLDDLGGWHLYDENLWLYSKKNNENESRTLENVFDWFEAKRLVIDGIEKRTLLVKYPDEIDELIRNGKMFYFIKQHISKISKKPLCFTLEEIEDFEKVISITNKNSGTSLFYGVWS